MKHLSAVVICCLISISAVSAWENYEYSLEGIQKRELDVVDLCKFDESNP